MSAEDQPLPPPKRGLRRTAARAGTVAHLAIGAIRATRFVLWRIAEVVLALIIIFEEWGWKPLSAFLAQLARLRPVAALEAGIARLPPYPALAVFALPTVLLFPLKLVALWLIANGQVVSATALFIGAKIAGTAFLARIFQLTQPALMQLAWFARLYGIVMPWKYALVERVKASAVWLAAKAFKQAIVNFAMPTVQRITQAMRRLLGRQ